MNTRFEMCGTARIFKKTFYAYFHIEDKNIFMLDHKKPEWLMREQPYFQFLGAHEVWAHDIPSSGGCGNANQYNVSNGSPRGDFKGKGGD